jgi:hypothetical protein
MSADFPLHGERPAATMAAGGGASHPRPELATPYVAPQGKLEERLAALFAAVLGRTTASIPAVRSLRKPAGPARLLAGRAAAQRSQSSSCTRSSVAASRYLTITGV